MPGTHTVIVEMTDKQYDVYKRLFVDWKERCRGPHTASNFMNQVLEGASAFLDFANAAETLHIDMQTAFDKFTAILDKRT